MPGTIHEVTVETSRDGKAGYIMLTPRNSPAVSMKKMPVQAMIEYHYGYMKVGMGEAYTIRMLSNEFWALTQNQWEIYPKIGYRRLIDGTVVHDITEDFGEFRTILAHDAMITLPVRIQEERGRGIEIHSVADQAKLLQYWAWSRQPIDIGVLVPETKHTIDFWMDLTLQPQPGDEEVTTYPLALKELWLEKLRQMSPTVARNLETLGNDFGMKIRYLYNNLRVWFAPDSSIASGLNRSLAEDPVAKDEWVSNDMMAFSYPTMTDEEVKESPTALFVPGRILQEWYDDPEVQGGKIALIATDNNKVQKPPNFLDRMQSTFLKQSAYN
jgi:hypothetical protein